MAPVVAEKFGKLQSMMNEKLKRRWAACEAMALGRGGISVVSRATGMSRATIRKGIREVEEGYPDLADQITGRRIRRPGGGRRRLAEQDPDLRWGMTAFVDIYVGAR